MGVHGPTSAARLGKIASICEVSSLFIGSAFERLDRSGSGRVEEDKLLAAAEERHTTRSPLPPLARLWLSLA